MPWSLPIDWENFKRVTAGHAFIMGRKSHESPHALHSDTQNVILSRQKNLDLPDGFDLAGSLEEAIALLAKEPLVFVLGGAAIFDQALPLADYLYLTLVHHHFEGDTYFPAVNRKEWTLIQSKAYDMDENHDFPFSINVYERKS